MSYTIHKIAQLAGISSRTLRYYDKIGLLKPAYINDSGYRMYGEAEIDILQQIMFYREMDMPLEEIKSIMQNPNFDIRAALIFHRHNLQNKKERLDKLLHTIDSTLVAQERKIPMENQEKFSGFKEALIIDNEQKYGDEIRTKYGADEVFKQNTKLRFLSEEKFNRINEIDEALFIELQLARNENTEKRAMIIANLHQEWLQLYSAYYSREMHLGIVAMYLEDIRFMSYYDNKAGQGATKILHDAVMRYI